MNDKNTNDSKTILVDTAPDLPDQPESEDHIKDMFENPSEQKSEKKQAVMHAKNNNTNGPSNLK